MKSLDRDPIVLVSNLARLLRTLADARARAYGMTRAQWMILVHLDRQAGMSQNELASLIEVEPITVGRLVDRLEARGMVERRPDPQDRRIWRLHLTPEAGPMLKEIDAVRAELTRVRAENERLQGQLQQCRNRSLELVETRRLSTGVVILVYRPQ